MFPPHQTDVLVMGPYFLMKSAENLQLSEGRQALAVENEIFD